jgi:hypothetical protein
MFAYDSYIRRSGQSWKIWLSLILLTIAGMAVFIGLFSINRIDESSSAVIVLGGIFLGLIEFVWVSVSVRCRKCGTRPVWNAFRREPHDSWLASLLNDKQCPRCGDDGSDLKL